jgi:hypothetical protein
MARERDPRDDEKSEEVLDEEAEERWEDESPAGPPHLHLVRSDDPDESPEQPDDEA